MCLGSGCIVAFEDTIFDKCSLVVLEGAQARLTRPQFQDMGASTAGLSICADGSGTEVIVQGGSITGGTQGVLLQAGGSLQASDFTIAGVEGVGIEAKDKGSNLDLTNCKLSAFAPENKELHILQCAMHVYGSAIAHLSTVHISGMRFGLDVCTLASAQLADCSVTGTESMCVRFQKGGTGNLKNCTLEGSKSDGLYVDGEGSRAVVCNCQFIQNECGAVAVNAGVLTADGCASSGNKNEGYIASAKGVVELTSCTSDGDGGDDWGGCAARTEGKLTGHKVTVTASAADGFRVEGEGEVVLRECSATKCKENGIYASMKGSRLDAEGCTVERNGECGVCAESNSVVEVRNCRSVGNTNQGYCATGGAQMTVTSSSSNGDEAGCSTDDGGALNMEAVTVNGISQSGKLP